MTAVIPDYDIQSALNGRLISLDLGEDIPMALENKEYKPTLGTKYLSTWLLPAEPEIRELGPNPIQERRGLFQITVVGAEDMGWAPLKRIAAAIVDHYKAGTLLVAASGLKVRCLRAWPGPGIPDNGWYRIPVSVSYNSFWT